MRKLRLAGAVAALLVGSAAFGVADMHGPESLLGFNPLGPVFGAYSATYESKIDDNWSWFVSGAYVNPRLSLIGLFLFDSTDAWSLWALGGGAGGNYYLSGTALKGPFIGAGVIAAYAQVDDDKDNPPVAVSGFGFGGEVHLGYRIMWGPVSIAPQIGGAYTYTLIDLSGFNPEGTPPEDRINLSAISGFSLTFGLGLAIALP